VPVMPALACPEAVRVASNLSPIMANANANANGGSGMGRDGEERA